MAITNTTAAATATSPVPVSSPESSLAPLKGVQNSDLAPGIREMDLPAGITVPDPVHGKFIKKLLEKKQQLEHLKDHLKQEHHMRSNNIPLEQTAEEIAAIHEEFDALSPKDFREAIDYDYSLKTEEELKDSIKRQDIIDLSNSLAERTNKWPLFVLCKNEGALSKKITIECTEHFSKKITHTTMICPAKRTMLVNIRKFNGQITIIEKTGTRGTETSHSIKGKSFGAQLGAKFEQLNAPNTFGSLREMISHISTTLSDNHNWKDLLSFAESLLEGLNKRDNPRLHREYKELKEQALTGLRSVELLLKEARKKEL